MTLVVHAPGKIPKKKYLNSSNAVPTNDLITKPNNIREKPLTVEIPPPPSSLQWWSKASPDLIQAYIIAQKNV